ncbi:MAG: AarF/ABC1/UbiB kinase family protein, partial [Gemmatimonadetes bacterium]|nr:AarF/ABC1/UbiB kinase family protein [Gemmatimonadota bacterium]NIQ58934.1 AarF/ABC1/UbiB kinase family protein [Gemmatimonadota bacterium]NIU79124.1 AarF/ABC1/UbiB kinase family protein [Gammaproteobacteria bacterium]NIX47828.1 AarF/ABC1/UbiB kinase family protein [Gemmatimonadota bacterium]NIY12193.1 AarF/ABC1/UbiB kinase family protein [Gemmatimonadota bacterium]
RADALDAERRRRLRSLGLRATAALLRPFLRRELRREPFPRQLRRRLELLGPTYVKLGQIMAIREDLLPAAVCRELQQLFDHVPPVPFAEVERGIAAELGRPAAESFRWIDPEPLGSASIAQAHRAETVAGDAVVLKVMRPGIRRSIETDLKLLTSLGALLQRFLPRYQPRRIVEEFAAYTIREVDFTVEADNAETFAANFADMPEVSFPAIHRELSTPSLLTMEYIDGFKPSDPAARGLSDADRERLIDLGAGAIIRMLYRDGFFHADLHPANLLVLPGDPPTIGFVDLGMAGRFEDRTRRRMLYYYHALVTRDVEGAATFLTDMASLGKGADPDAFRRAVIDLSRRFVTRAERGEFSIAQLILESIGLGGRYRVYFPVEMTLMVKALVTFEGVGRMLDPRLDVTAVSRRHVARILRGQFTLPTLSRELLRETPELIDVAVELPQLLVEAARFLERTFDQRPPPDPAVGLRTAVLAGACLLGAVLTLTADGPAALWIVLFALAAVLAVRK